MESPDKTRIFIPWKQFLHSDIKESQSENKYVYIMYLITVEMWRFFPRSITKKWNGREEAR